MQKTKTKKHKDSYELSFLDSQQFLTSPQFQLLAKKVSFINTLIDSRNLNQQKEFKISENRDLKTTDSNPTKENNIDQTQATEEKKE